MDVEFVNEETSVVVLLLLHLCLCNDRVDYSILEDVPCMLRCLCTVNHRDKASVEL